MKIPYLIGIKAYGILIFFASLFNSKAKKRLEGQRKVFSFLSENIDSKEHHKYIWFHAASLGEFEQGRPIIEKLKLIRPEYKILLTFFSPSGYEVRKNYEGADLVCYLPLDTPSNVKRFINIVKPQKAIFIKYEFWPNFLLYCKKHRIPTYVVSANFRQDQIFFKWYGSKYASVLRTFEQIFVQDIESKFLLKKIGVENVEVAGDTRFDRVIEIAGGKKDLPIVKEFKSDKKLIIAGSSWPKDEDMLIEYLQENLSVKLLIAPHEIHESHLADIENKLNVPFIRYSNATIENVKDASCLIIDCFGLLSSLYQYANIAYIGGGFGVGIHNIIEAAVYGIPVVFGPNYEKFREARELVAKGGAFSIHEYWQLQSTFDWMLLDEGNTGRICYEYVHENQGATEKIMNCIFS
jgi:3-deoxy-D-manno-octulosonic-acid transferase